MADYKVGQTATNAKGQKVQFDGGNWVRMAAPAGSPTATIDKTSGAFLNDLGTQASAAGESEITLNRAKQAAQQLDTGPYRGAFLDAAIPNPGDGGFWDKFGANTVGTVAKVTGAISNEDIQNYQLMKSLQNKEVLNEQIKQKGPQTESDAARMALTTFGPNQVRANNMDIIDHNITAAQRQQAKAIFYTQFANKFGLHGTSPHGYTADQLWANQKDNITHQALPQSAPHGAPMQIKVISRRSVP